MIRVITYGSRWAVIRTAGKHDPVILSLHATEGEARQAATYYG